MKHLKSQTTPETPSGHCYILSFLLFTCYCSFKRTCIRNSISNTSRTRLSFQESEDGRTYFLKIHVPWEVLATYADVLKIKVPFKTNDIPDKKDVPMSWLCTPYSLPEHVMQPEPDYFTASFDKSKTDFFLIEDKDTFFPPSTRNRIVRKLGQMSRICTNITLS